MVFPVEPFFLCKAMVTMVQRGITTIFQGKCLQRKLEDLSRLLRLGGPKNTWDGLGRVEECGVQKWKEPQGDWRLNS